MILDPITHVALILVYKDKLTIVQVTLILLFLAMLYKFPLLSNV